MATWRIGSQRHFACSALASRASVSSARHPSTLQRHWRRKKVVALLLIPNLRLFASRSHCFLFQTRVAQVVPKEQVQQTRVTEQHSPFVDLSMRNRVVARVLHPVVVGLPLADW